MVNKLQQFNYVIKVISALFNENIDRRVITNVEEVLLTFHLKQPIKCQGLYRGSQSDVKISIMAALNPPTEFDE